MAAGPTAGGAAAGWTPAAPPAPPIVPPVARTAPAPAFSRQGGRPAGRNPRRTARPAGPPLLSRLPALPLGASRLGSGPRRALRLGLARHRRIVAACLLLASTWVVVRSAAPPPPETVAVLVAARDLPAGTALAGADLRVAEWPADGLPGGGLAAAAGRVLASPLRAGEPVTDARVLGPGLLTGQPAGTVALPIRLADPAAAGVVRAGDRVDVLSSEGPAGSAADSSAARPGYAGGPSGGAERVAYGALVLAVRGVTGATTLAGGAGDPGGGLGGLMGGAAGGPDAAGTDPGGMLVLAVSASEAGRLTAAQTGGYLGIAVLPR